MPIITKYTLDSDNATEWTLLDPGGSPFLSDETTDGTKIQEGSGSQKLENMSFTGQHTVNKALSNRNWANLDFKMEYFVPAQLNITTTLGVQVIFTDVNDFFSIWIWNSTTTTPKLEVDWNTLHILDISDAAEATVAVRSAEFDPSNVVDILWSYQQKSTAPFTINDWYSDFVRFEADVFPVLGNGPEGGVLDITAYAAAGTRYAATNINLNVVVQKPIKLDRLMDEIASQARTRAYWGRTGHTLKFMEDAAQITLSGTPVRTFEEDQKGVTDIVWKNTTTAVDIRNTITAVFDRDWVRTARRDEAYTGSITREDPTSTGVYGKIANEVNNTDRSFFYDFVVASGHATQLADLYLDFKSFPKKEFSIKADWTQLDLEPEDEILVSGVELRTSVTCRVDDIKIRSDSFIDIVATEV